MSPLDWIREPGRIAEEMEAIRIGRDLKRILAADEFAVTAENGPPMDCDAYVNRDALRLSLRGRI